MDINELAFVQNFFAYFKNMLVVNATKINVYRQPMSEIKMRLDSMGVGLNEALLFIKKIIKIFSY